MLDAAPPAEFPLAPEAPDERGFFARVKDPLDDDGFKSAVQALIARARDHMDSEILPAVEKAARYRKGEVDATPMQPAGLDPATGELAYEGSRVVMTECRDTEQAMLPELVRVFIAGEHAVEFTPGGKEDVEGADQATDYIGDEVFRRQCDGENKLVDMALDWLGKFCALKVWWEVEERREGYSFDGLDDAALAILRGEDEIAGLEIEPYQETIAAPQPLPDGSVAWVPQPVTLYRGRYVRLLRSGRESFEVIPPEEFLIDPDAPTADRAVLVGQDCDRLVSDVVALGVPYEQIRPHIGQTRGDRAGVRQTRSGAALAGGGGGETGDDALAYVRVVEAQVRVDRDGDGIAERYRVLALGEEAEIVFASADDDTGWIVASPYRVPHRPIGLGVVESVMDLQDLGTAAMRGVLNSLSRSIAAREIVNDDDPRTLEDLARWYGGPIRSSRQGAVEIHAVPFTGQAAFPLFDLIESRKAARTGISQAGQGLDPDAIKGQTLEGAHAIVSAPQSRMEFLVREFGIGLLRPLFKHLLMLSVKYQRRERVIRLRNKWVPVDPRSWNAGMDAMPRVGLGKGTRGERFLGLQMIAAKQEMLLAQGSPLVTPVQYRATLALLAELAGERDVDKFFVEATPDLLQRHAAQQQQAMQAQVQQQVQAALAMEQAKAQARAAGAVQQAQGVAQVNAGIEAGKAEAATAQAARLAGIKAGHDQATALRKSDLDTEAKLRIEQLRAALAREQSLLDFRLKQEELDRETVLERERMASGDRAGQGNIEQVTS